LSVLVWALAAAVLSPVVREGSIPAPWRVVTLPQQKFPVTQYEADAVEGRAALRITAKGSYGNLVHDLPRMEAPRRLQWNWRVQQANPLVDLTQKTGDDTPVKVCLGFDLPLGQVPFVERQMLRMARARSPEALPGATLCWVWGGAEPRGTLLHNAYTSRVRYIVLRNASDAGPAWFAEDRDVAADFRRAFGQEAGELPPVTAVIVAGDADNTGGQSLAFVSGLRSEP
jgi:hypothetical protein